MSKGATTSWSKSCIRRVCGARSATPLARSALCIAASASRCSSTIAVVGAFSTLSPEPSFTARTASARSWWRLSKAWCRARVPHTWLANCARGAVRCFTCAIACNETPCKLVHAIHFPIRSLNTTRCTKTLGKKGRIHLDPADPPRKRANKVKGHGTWDKDRPPVVGAFGRNSGQARLDVCESNGIADLQPHIEAFTVPGTCLNTDEWCGYNRVEESGRQRQSVCHAPGQRVWARDLDGDGKREVHVNTAEGFWTGLRNFLRPFRGVNKVYLLQYVIVHEWSHNLKTVTNQFLRAMCGVTQLRT